MAKQFGLKQPTVWSGIDRSLLEKPVRAAIANRPSLHATSNDKHVKSRTSHGLRRPGRHKNTPVRHVAVPTPPQLRATASRRDVKLAAPSSCDHPPSEASRWQPHIRTKPSAKLHLSHAVSSHEAIHYELAKALAAQWTLLYVKAQHTFQKQRKHAWHQLAILQHHLCELHASIYQLQDKVIKQRHLNQAAATFHAARRLGRLQETDVSSTLRLLTRAVEARLDGLAVVNTLPVNFDTLLTHVHHLEQALLQCQQRPATITLQRQLQAASSLQLLRQETAVVQGLATKAVQAMEKHVLAMASKHLHQLQQTQTQGVMVE
eukprot:m.14358 g.14358  ORF g.14358 m.14358 type:complete len:319 (+) comp10264_c0_seq1:132-1088(+)